jgi:alkylated DNA nucleotide flippase Atl1
MRGLLAAKDSGRGSALAPPRPISPFERAVARVVRRIPPGTTLGYGEVALRSGKRGAARLVVRALHRLEGLPWWRVARKDGTLAPMVAFEQEQLLRAEGWRGPRGAAGPEQKRGGETRAARSQAGRARGRGRGRAGRSQVGRARGRAAHGQDRARA